MKIALLCKKVCYKVILV